jgi:hypothetical protein
MYNHWMHRCRVRGRVAFFVSLLASSAFAISDGPDILFLNSYHPGLYWSEQVQEGVRQNLGPHEQFAVEHLDSKHFEGGGGDSLFAAEFRFKYAVHSPKLIVSSDDYALRFLLHWRDSLFPAVPVVFCGVNNYEPSLLADRKGYTGLSQLNQMAQTIELWTKIRPRITDVWLITESSATGSGNRTRFDSLAKTYQGRLRFHFFDSGNGIAWSDLLDKVSRLGSQDLVYWSELFRDKNGLYIDPDQDLPQLAERSAVPIASHSEQYVVTGAAGGVCNRGLLHGRQAGRLMRRVLAGASPDTIAISGDSSIGVVFRWDQIQRFGIDPSLLPEGTFFFGSADSGVERLPCSNRLRGAGYHGLDGDGDRVDGCAAASAPVQAAHRGVGSRAAGFGTGAAQGVRCHHRRGDRPRPRWPDQIDQFRWSPHVRDRTGARTEFDDRRPFGGAGRRRSRSLGPVGRCDQRQRPGVRVAGEKTEHRRNLRRGSRADLDVVFRGGPFGRSGPRCGRKTRSAQAFVGREGRTRTEGGGAHLRIAAVQPRTRGLLVFRFPRPPGATARHRWFRARARGRCRKRPAGAAEDLFASHPGGEHAHGRDHRRSSEAVEHFAYFDRAQSGGHGRCAGGRDRRSGPAAAPFPSGRWQASDRAGGHRTAQAAMGQILSRMP